METIHIYTDDAQRRYYAGEFVDPEDFIEAPAPETPLTAEQRLLAYLDSGETTEEAMFHAVSVYKDAKSLAEGVAKPFQQLMDMAKVQISDIMAETGVMSWKTANGNAYVPAAGVSVSYDAKSLDALCASSPELKAILWPHRSVHPRRKRCPLDPIGIMTVYAVRFSAGVGGLGGGCQLRRLF